MKKSVKHLFFAAFAACLLLARQPEASAFAAGTESGVSVLQAASEEEPLFGYQPDILRSRDTVQSGSCGDNITWTLSDGSLILSGSGAMDSCSSGAPWYASRSSITSVIISEGITSIGNGAFYDCYNLTSVSIPSTIRTIDRGAFAGCSSLDAITLGNQVSSIGDYAFQQCAISTITLPASLSDVSYLAFFKCYSLTSIQVASGNAAYQSQDGVLFSKDGTTLLTYPAGKQGSYAIPSTVTKIGDAAFLGSSITQITIPGRVTSLGESAFQQSDLTSLTIPNSVTEIGNFLCYECYSLQSLKIGSGLSKLSYKAFQSCTSLTSVDLGKITDLDYLAFAYCSALPEITIPSSVTVINNGSFGECTSLVKVVLPDTVTGISYQAFLNCTSLSQINFPESLTVINRYAFYGCTSLTSVTLPSSIKEVGEHAFPDTTEIKNVPDTMVKMEDGSYLVLAKVTITVEESYSKAFEVLNLVNEERTKAGLSELKMDQELLEAAMLRAAETVLYWDHTRPSGRDCFTASSLMCAENIAAGSTTAEGVMKQWMNSAGHKANILTDGRQSIGIGCVIMDGSYYWVQCFGDEISSAVSASYYADGSKKRTIYVSTDEEYFKPQYKISAASIFEGASAAITTTWGGTAIPASVLNYKSSNPDICKVSKGKLTGVKAGTATISVWFSGAPDKAKTFKITVKAPASTTTKTYTVKFNKNGGTKLSTSSKKVKSGSALGTLPTVQRKGYTLKGWYTKPSGGTKVTKTTKITKNRTLYAQWTKVTKPSRTTVTLKSTKKSTVTVSFKKVKGASGYEISYSTNKKFPKKSTTVLTTTNVKKTIKSLTSKKTYYVRVRAYKVDSAKQKIYGSYSAVKKITVK
ncbi:MAG: leucine-rich repeat protein [Eubacteriales bacterium]|nr:leucine-rich repeat protein [Eubacteriales bacterium]